MRSMHSDSRSSLLIRRSRRLAHPRKWGLDVRPQHKVIAAAIRLEDRSGYESYNSRRFGEEYDRSPSPENLNISLWYAARKQSLREWKDILGKKPVERPRASITTLKTQTSFRWTVIPGRATKIVISRGSAASNIGKFVVFLLQKSLLNWSKAVKEEIRQIRKHQRNTDLWKRSRRRQVVQVAANEWPIRELSPELRIRSKKLVPCQHTAADIRQTILKGGTSSGWSPGKRSSKLKTISKVQTVSTLPKIPLPPINWFRDEARRQQRSEPPCERLPQNLFLGQGADFDHSKSLKKLKKDFEQLEKQVDSCLKKSLWSNMELPPLIYRKLRLQAIYIARSFYNNDSKEFLDTLRGSDGMIVHPVQEAIVVAKLIDLLDKHFVIFPYSVQSQENGTKLIMDAMAVKTHLRMTDPEFRIRRLLGRRKHILSAYSRAGFDARRTYHVGVHANRLLRAMKAYEHDLLQRSSALCKLLHEHMLLFCQLALSFSTLLRTHSQVWQLEAYPIGARLSIDHADVLGDLNGRIDRGLVKGCVVALNVCPALVYSRDGTSSLKWSAEKAWVVIEDLQTVPNEKESQQLTGANS